MILNHTLWSLPRNKVEIWSVFDKCFHFLLFFGAQRAERLDMPLFAIVLSTSTKESLNAMPETNAFFGFHAGCFSKHRAELGWCTGTVPRKEPQCFFHLARVARVWFFGIVVSATFIGLVSGIASLIRAKVVLAWRGSTSRDVVESYCAVYFLDVSASQI